MSVTTINPANGRVIRTWEDHSPAEIETALQESSEAFQHWRKVPLETRLECVRVFAEGLKGARIELAELMTAEMGKPNKEALGEIDKCVASSLTLREWYPKWKAETEESGKTTGYAVTHEPLGPILGIMPWNFPAWQVVRFAIPTLLSGNSILLKHAECTYGSGEFLEELFRGAFPDSLYINLRADHKAIENIIADWRVRGVSLTGSVRAGHSVAEQSGRALKKCVLELGGSDAYVILDDADLDHAAEVCARARLVNSGQSCVAAKRFIVTKKNYTAFCEKMSAQLKAHPPIGPIARKDLRDQLHEQVQESLAKGAKVLFGAELPEGPGYFYPVSALANVKPGMPAFDGELFGPVAAIIEAADEKEAIRLANQSVYGLGGAVFSKDVARAQKLAREEFEAGMVAVNDMVASNAMAPFGGVKDSGLGRELGRLGCFEFTNIKSVYTKP